MPAPYPQEFRDDVVRVVRTREDGVTLAQVAKDFGIHEMTLSKWLRQADIDNGERPGLSRAEATEVRLPLPHNEAGAAGESTWEQTAWRICRDNQWFSAFGTKRGKNGKHPGPPVHDDLVKRDFTAGDVNELWLTDITEHPTGKGKLYLCAIKHVFSGRTVGYSISDRMKARLAVNALDNTVSRRGDVAGCIVHSDRGSQFRSRTFVLALNRHHPIGSMGQIGAAGDNAAMESFFALLQKNVLDRKRWRTREELRIAIITGIERTYHRRRRQVRLGRLTPIEYETIMNPIALAA